MARNGAVELDDFFSRNLIVHTHLEKTAGTSLVYAFADLFGKDAVFDTRTRKFNPASLDPVEMAKIRVLTGHFHFRTQETSVPRTPVYVACVREPFERFRSYVNYAGLRDTHPMYETVAGKTLGEIVEGYLARSAPQASNYACRYLGRGGGFRTAAFRAISNIEKRYVAVVPQHRVNDLIGKFFGVFSTVVPRTYVMNQAPEYDQSDEGRDLFRKNNQQDYAVYDYVMENHERWLDAFDARLEERST